MWFTLVFTVSAVNAAAILLACLSGTYIITAGHREGFTKDSGYG